MSHPRLGRAFAVVQYLMKREGLDCADARQVSLRLEHLIARERFFGTIGDVRERTQAVPEDVPQRDIDEAVEDVESNVKGVPRAGGCPSTP